MHILFSIGRRPSISDISMKDLTQTNIRNLSSIAVIDDQKFMYAEILRSHGFNLTEIGDITDLEAVASYDIVVCDIKGVGASFGSKYEGAHVISELRKHYPDKYLIAFSGGQFDPSYKRFFDSCDVSIKKDADMDDWTIMLDSAAEQLSNPAKRWLRVRTILMQEGIDIYEILQLEIEYVKAVINRSPDALIKAFSGKKHKNRELIAHIGAGLGAFIGKLIATI